MKYYHNNECIKFRYSYRKDTKLNEEDATVSWIKNILSHIILIQYFTAMVVKRKSCYNNKWVTKCNKFLSGYKWSINRYISSSKCNK